MFRNRHRKKSICLRGTCAETEDATQSLLEYKYNQDRSLRGTCAETEDATRHTFVECSYCEVSEALALKQRMQHFVYTPLPGCVQLKSDLR